MHKNDLNIKILMFSVQIFECQKSNNKRQTNFTAILEMGLNQVPQLFDCLQKNTLQEYYKHSVFNYLLQI